jgi:hypothetical protein
MYYKYRRNINLRVWFVADSSSCPPTSSLNLRILIPSFSDHWRGRQQRRVQLWCQWATPGDVLRGRLDVADIYHSNIYNASGLADVTEHMLFLNVTSVGKNSIEFSNIHLDYMIVTQPVAAAVVQGPTFFDDTDPAFMYNGSWLTGNGTGRYDADSSRRTVTRLIHPKCGCTRTVGYVDYRR